MNPNNELDRERLIKAIENSPHPTPPPGRRAREIGLHGMEIPAAGQTSEGVE
tara:strand:- start:818 stop:973 length:156 start_codon:yes stop_codon:yes gene_type:complete